MSAIAFAGAGLDRADHIRSDPSALEALMDWRARLLKLDGLDPVIDPEGRLSWGTLGDAGPDSELVFLGLGEGKACFAEVPPALTGSVAPANPRLWAAMAALGRWSIGMRGTAFARAAARGPCSPRAGGSAIAAMAIARPNTIPGSIR
jgi:NAD+ diphosphatase